MPTHQQANQERPEEKATGKKPQTDKLGPVSPLIDPRVGQRARLDPRRLSPAEVSQLQRTIGNRAVGKLLSEMRPRLGNQAGPTVEAAHASSEPEAGRVASPVVGPIQRTVWRYKSGAWSIETPKQSTDTDGYEDADTYCNTHGITPEAFDKYDQNTGRYYEWAEARGRTERRAGARTRPKGYGGFFGAGREVTPYGIFKPRGAGEARNMQSQGPHLLAHVTKRTVFDMAESMGLLPRDVLGSKLSPSPRQAFQMMKDMLDKRGLAYKPGAMYKWYQEYKSAYNKAKGGGRGSKQALKELLELHPLTTYRVGEVATGAELAGKKENAEESLEDVDTILAALRSGGIPGGLTTVDRGYKGEGWAEGDPLRTDLVFNYAYAATGRPPSPSPYPEAPMSPTRDDDW